MDAKLALLAVPQHSILTLLQLVEAGITASGVRKRTAAKRLHRIHRGVYSLTPPQLLTYKGRLMAAVLACGPGAVLSHRSAADLLGIRAMSRARIDVTALAHRDLDGVDIHRSRTLTAADVTVVDRIPCTTIARTQLDLADVVPLDQVERTLNQADVMQVLDYRSLADQLERNGTRRAAAVLRQAMRIYDPGQAPTESRLEADFVALIRSAGLPSPERQVRLVLDDGEEPFRVDFVWRAHRVVLETDGRKTHGTRRAFETDRRRDQRLVRARWQVVRVTWRQLQDDPASVVALVADLLAGG